MFTSSWIVKDNQLRSSPDDGSECVFSDIRPSTHLIVLTDIGAVSNTVALSRVLALDWDSFVHKQS